MGFLNVAIEIPVFLIMFTLMLGAPINTNFIIYRTCYVLMGRNQLDCAKLGLNTSDNATNELEKEVEPIANYISMTMDLLTLIVPCFLCIFIGPWSDKRGRKPILILTLTGFAFSNIIKVIVAAMPHLSPWFLIFQSVPMLLSGGLPTFIMISFCYLIDITNADNRGLRMGIMEGVFGLGMLLGLYLSAHLFELIDYTGVFLVCTVLSVLAWLVTILLLRETVETRQENTSFFTFDHIKDVCHTTFKKREGFNRFILLVCIGSLIMYVMSENNGGTEALLLRSKFHWDLEKITTYSTIRSCISIVGGFLGIYILHTVLGVSELPLILIGLTFCAVNTFIVATAQFDWQIYAAGLLRIMSSVVTPMIRSLLSKIIPHAEIGQVFSFGISLESLMTMTAGPIYTIVYTSSINGFAGAFDLIPFSLHVINIVLFTFIVILKRRSNAIVYLNIPEELTDDCHES